MFMKRYEQRIAPVVCFETARQQDGNVGIASTSLHKSLQFGMWFALMAPE